MSTLNTKTNKNNIIKDDKSLSHLKVKRFGKFATSKTKVLNFSDYVPNENEKFVLENGLRFSVPFRQHRECIFSEFEILTGELKHCKPFSQNKLDRCHAELYDLSHFLQNTRIYIADFKIIKIVYGVPPLAALIKIRP